MIAIGLEAHGSFRSFIGFDGKHWSLIGWCGQ
jgi:hypothetical protein